MKDRQSQAHVKWECKYHVVIVPKYRKKVMYGGVTGYEGQPVGQFKSPSLGQAPIRAEAARADHGLVDQLQGQPWFHPFRWLAGPTAQ